jgi:hypothetical protein
MARSRIVWLIAAGLFAVSCSRDFERPPDRVELELIWPTRGFTSDAVALCATHLDPDGSANEVSFGTVPAEVLGFDPPADWRADGEQAWTCAEPALFVRVPVLPAEGLVSVQVTNATGRAGLTSAFDYLGPGHPVHQRVKRKLTLRAGLWSLFAPPGIPGLAYGAISREANLVSLFEPNLGMHLDFGQCDMPLSGAAAITDLFLDLLDPESWRASIKVVWVNGLILDPNASSDQSFGLEMWAWEIDLKQLLFERTLDTPESVYMPSTADRQPFRPALVWAFPRIDEPLLHGVVVTHIQKPALAIFPTAEFDMPVVVELPDQSPHCRAGSAERLGPIVGLVHDDQARVFYVALAFSNEIWRISEDGQSVARAWPPPNPTGFEDQIDCAWVNSSLAIRKSHSSHEQLRLYVGDGIRARVQVLQPTPTPDGEAMTPVASQSMAFDGLPYALTTGRFPTKNTNGTDVTGEHLYVATQNGLVVLDVTAYFPVLLPGLHSFARLGEIPVPSNRGAPQSLITSDNFALLGGADTIALADAHNDLVRFFTAGQEQLQLADVTIGASLPHVAGSYQPDRLFLTDALSNAVQVVDRNSGLRLGQFNIASLSNHALMGFLSTGMSSLRTPEFDLLLLPLLDLDLEIRPGEFQENISNRYHHLAHGRIGTDLPACGLDSPDMQVETGIDEVFHDMRLVFWDWQGRSQLPVLVLNRRAETTQVIDSDGQPTGEQIEYQARTWCLELDPNGPPDRVLAAGAAPLCDLRPQGALTDQVLWVRPARKAPVIARLEQEQQAGQTAALKLRMLILDSSPKLATEGIEARIGAELEPYITDLLVTIEGPPDQPIYVVHLPLSYMGRVLQVRFDPATETSFSAFVETGGTPFRLYQSPDDRQIYVIMPLEGRVDILNLGCVPTSDPTCQPLAASLDVGPFPFQIEFDDSGRHAHAIHLFSNAITMIE